MAPRLDANVAEDLVKSCDLRKRANPGAILELPDHFGGCLVDLDSQLGAGRLDRYSLVQDRPGAEAKILAGI